MNNVAEMLKSYRERRGWTLAELAECTGLSMSFLSDIERGRTTPSLDTLDKIAKGYGLNLLITFSNGHHDPDLEFRVGTAILATKQLLGNLELLLKEKGITPSFLSKYDPE